MNGRRILWASAGTGGWHKCSLLEESERMDLRMLRSGEDAQMNCYYYLLTLLRKRRNG